MKINECISCGNCFEFADSDKCPTGSFVIKATHGYARADIIESTCIDCGICKDEIECFNEAIGDE